MEDLPAEEVTNAMKYVLQNQINLSKEELVRETAKLFGFARIGANMEAVMMNGINKAIEKGFAVRDGERIICKES